MAPSALVVGTTGIKAIAVSESGEVVARAERRYPAADAAREGPAARG